MKELEKLLQSEKLISILYGVSYQGNVGSCYRTANIIGETIPTVLVKPCQQQLQIENDKQDAKNKNKQVKRYHTNSIINYVVSVLVDLINRIINTNVNIKTEYASPYNSNGTYCRDFIRGVKYYSTYLNKTQVPRPLVHGVDWDSLVPLLIKHQYQICIIENDDQFEKFNLYDFPIHSEGKYAIVMGSETMGIPKDVFLQETAVIQHLKQIYIPSHHDKSLNVSVAHGIVLSYFNQKVFHN
jgi:tRNA(Leu) C34 or U34 (ribose-2'-O)-methylase TrmL